MDTLQFIIQLFISLSQRLGNGGISPFFDKIFSHLVPISYELGDLEPQINIILGTPRALFSHDSGEPLMKISGTPPLPPAIVNLHNVHSLHWSHVIILSSLASGCQQEQNIATTSLLQVWRMTCLWRAGK